MEVKMKNFQTICKAVGLELMPQLEPFYLKWIKQNNTLPLIDKNFVINCAKKYNLDDENLSRLLKTIDEIESNEDLLYLACFLRDDMCAARHRCDVDDYHAMMPQCMKEKELFSFIMLMSCVEPSLKRVESLNMPKELYENIPFTPLKKQMEKLQSTGDGTVADFPWDMNFYTVSIFLLDRFYFIPFKLEDNIIAYKNKKTGEVKTFFAHETILRADGQINGVNGQNCPKGKSSFKATEAEIIGTPINPCGLCDGIEIKISKDDWECVLKEGDILLGVHIPGGEGYTPQRLATSTHLAKQIFEKYFPQICIKGFGSESWLYDPHLRLMLNPSSNIISMQNCMYIYPIESGDGMIFEELFGGKKPINELNEKTSLQKNVKHYMMNSGKFTAAGMFILAQDQEKIATGSVYSNVTHINDAMSLLEVKI